MPTINDGGPAFPGDLPTVQPNGNKLPFAPGMSLRDWFAGQALAGMLADQTFDAPSERLAAASYDIADAMLRARQALENGPASLADANPNNSTEQRGGDHE